jgi:hypothetical protein
MISIPLSKPESLPTFGSCSWSLAGFNACVGGFRTVRWTLATMLGVVLSSMVRPYVAFYSSLIMSGAVGA